MSTFEVPPEGLSLCFDPGAQTDQFLMLEVSEDMLKELTVNADHGYELRGTGDSEAVLVTTARTFSVRLVETSNTALLLSEMSAVAEQPAPIDTDDDVGGAPPSAASPPHHRLIQGRISRHYELAEIRPQFQALRTLLTARPYNGVDDDAEDEASLYSFDQLRRVIQASDAQLSAALHALFAYDIGGVYRTLHPGYQHALVTDVLNAVTETVQSPGDVDSTVLAQTLAHLYPPSLVIQTAQLLSPYTALSSSSSRHALCSQLLTRLHATRLFSESPSIPSPVLVAALTSHLPAPLVFDPAHLLGLALLMPSLPPQPPVYHWLPVWALAVDVRGRLADLFGIKERWTFEEMSGWLSDLCAVGEKVEALLMKHTRTVQDKDPHGVKRTLYVKR